MRVLFSLMLVFACRVIGAPVVEKYFPDPKSRLIATAAATGDSRTLSRLMAAGVAVDVRGRGNMTPLLWALLYQNKTGFEFLLTHGANPNIQLSETFDDLLTEGNSAMPLTSRFGQCVRV